MATKQENTDLTNIVVKVGGDYTVSIKEQFGESINPQKIKRFIKEIEDRYLQKYKNITIYPDDWEAHINDGEFSIYIQHLVHFNKIKKDEIKEKIDGFLKDNFSELKNRQFDWMTKPNFDYGVLKRKEINSDGQEQ